MYVTIKIFSSINFTHAVLWYSKNIRDNDPINFVLHDFSYIHVFFLLLFSFLLFFFCKNVKRKIQ